MYSHDGPLEILAPDPPYKYQPWLIKKGVCHEIFYPNFFMQISLRFRNHVLQHINNGPRWVRILKKESNISWHCPFKDSPELINKLRSQNMVNFSDISVLLKGQLEKNLLRVTLTSFNSSRSWALAWVTILDKLRLLNPQSKTMKRNKIYF